MILNSAALVLVAIRATVRLGTEARQAYLDATQRRALPLPLPSFEHGRTKGDALRFFARHPHHAEGGESDGIVYAPRPHLAALIELGMARRLYPLETKQLLEYYEECRQLQRAQDEGVTLLGSNERIDVGEVHALLTIRQWRRGEDSTPSTLHRIAGTLVSIGAESARTFPDITNPHSTRGRALLGLLDGLDRVDSKALEAAEVPTRLFVRALEAVTAHSDVLGVNDRVRELIAVTTQSVSESVAERLEAIDSQAIDREPMDGPARDAARLDAATWAEVVFRATIDSGVRHVLDQPERFLAIRSPGQSALVSEVGEAILDLVLADSRFGFGRVLSTEAGRAILDGGLLALAEHPELLVGGARAAIRDLVAALATDLAAIDAPLAPSLFPEIARIALARSAENLPLLWPDPDGDPRRNLVVTVATKTVAALTALPEEGARWRPKLGRSELLLIVELAVDELVENPGWLLTKAGKVSGTLETTLDAALRAMAERGDSRLSPALAAAVIRESILAVSRRKELLNRTPLGDADRRATILEAVLDMVLATVFGDGPDGDGVNAKAAWQLQRASATVGLVRTILDGLCAGEIDTRAVDRLRSLLKELVRDLTSGHGLDLDALRDALQSHAD